MQWKTVYIFVSSTFNDMHAERDRLVKRVFPELRLWCAKRKLQLREIDLRWGVSAADAQENKRVVEVCLRNIDKCRPFFLCFMGQRRGWVPTLSDVNPETLESFPLLREYVGKTSVTEMEVIHALLHPMENGKNPVRHARFYFRSDSYVRKLHTQAHKDLFVPGRTLLRNSDKAAEAFKKQIAGQYDTVSYTAQWNPELPSPELTGALSKGRLDDFRVENASLEADVLSWLKDAIIREYPDHQELSESADMLDRELDRQDTLRFQSMDGYIPRPVEEQALEDARNRANCRPVILEAEAGCGKTSLLAAFISKQTEKVYYRFVGTTSQSFRLEDLSHSLVSQWVRDGLLSKDSLDYPPGELVLMFPRLCLQAAQASPFLLVLDGMDQLQNGQNWLRWLPEQLPEKAGLIVSVRRGSITLPEGLLIHRLGLMTDPKDKSLMVSAYLSSFLKDIDNVQMERLLNMEGSSNPLFMKIVLNELRQHGSFDTLMELFQKDYGTTPLTAFRQVLLRMSAELKNTCFSPANAELLFFLCLANARQGLTGELFLTACRNLSGWTEAAISDKQVLDLIYGLARELEPYLMLDGGQIAIRYDSLRRAIVNHYGDYACQMANIMLAQAYLLRLYEHHDPEDAELTLDHILLATEDYIGTVMKRARVILLLLRWAGPEKLAKLCGLLVKQRKLPEYADLEKVLYKATARLETNPNTLFLELDRYGDRNNPVTDALLSQEQEEDTGVLLRPRYKADAYSTLFWEMPHPEPSSGCAVWTKPYYSTVSRDDILKVMDLSSHETVNILHLTRRQGYQEYRLAAEGDSLFLCLFTEKHSRVRIRRYRLPDLTLMEESPVLDCPHGNPWVLHAVHGSIYAMQFQNMPGSNGGRYSVCCLNTGELLFQKEFSKSIQYALKGNWFIYHDPASGDVRVLSLADGSCLFENRFLGTDHLDPNLHLTPYGRLFANSANLYTAFNQKLYLWLGGSRISSAGEIQLVQRMIRLVPSEEGLLQDGVWEEKVGHHSAFEVLDNGCLITESRGITTMLDGNCTQLGMINLGGDIHHIHETASHFAEFDGQLLLFLRDKVRSYDLKAFMAALNPTVEENFVGARSTVTDRGFLYLMNPEMDRIDLRTLECTREPHTKNQFCERYAPWSMPGEELWIGWGTTSNFSIKKPGTMELVFQGQIPRPEKLTLCHAFLYRDPENQTMRVGLVVRDTARTDYLTKKETQGFSRLRLLTKPLSRLSFSVGWTETDLGLDIPVFNIGSLVDPFCITVSGKPYLFLMNCRKDQWTSLIKVYDVLGKKFIFTREIDLHNTYQLSKDSVLIQPGCVIYATEENGEACLDILDFTVPKRYVIRRPLSLLTRDHCAEKVCLYDRDTREVLLYNRIDRKLTRVTELEEGYRPTHGILAGKYVVLSQFLNDTVRIYDPDTGKLLARQRLEASLTDALWDDVTGTLVMVDADYRKYFWQIDG